MAEVFRFPNNGYDVIVCKRDDIMKCIDDNIVDKEVAYAIIEQCERDAAEFISNGEWTGLPYIGNVKVPDGKKLRDDADQRALIEDAKEMLSKQDYIMFRKQLNVENIKKIKNDRYTNYITSMMVTRNKALYKHLVESKGESYAKFYLFSISKLTEFGKTASIEEGDLDIE